MKVIYIISLLIILGGTSKAQSTTENVAFNPTNLDLPKPSSDPSFLHFYLILRSVLHIRSYPNILPLSCRLDIMPEHELEPAISTPQKQIAHQSPIINIKWKTEPRNTQNSKSSNY